MKYLFSSMPKSGTAFLHRLFLSAGISSGHEYLYGIDFKNEKFKNRVDRNDVEVSWVSAPFLNTIDQRETKIFHLLRHPLKNVSSIYNLGYLYKNPRFDKAGEILNKFNFLDIKKVNTYNNIDRCFYFWIYWDKLIESYSNEFIKIEDITRNKIVFFNNLGYYNAAEKRLYSNHSFNHTNIDNLKLSIDDITDKYLKEEFVKILDKYHYNYFI